MSHPARTLISRALAIPVILLAGAASAAAQGEDGFLRGEGGFDAAFSFAYEEFDEFWIGDRKVSDPGVGRIRRYSYNLWAAYGVTDDLDVSANATYVEATSSGNTNDTSDFQDLTLRIKWRPFGAWRLGPGHLSVLAAPAVKLPIGHYENDFLTAIGDGQVDLRARVIVHYSFDVGIYAALETGYDHRFERTPAEIPVHLTVGGTIADVATVSAFYSHVESLGGYDILEGPFPGLEEEYDRVGLKVYVRVLDNFGLTATAFTTIDGRNTGDSDGFSVGAVVTF